MSLWISLSAYFYFYEHFSAEVGTMSQLLPFFLLKVSLIGSNKHAEDIVIIDIIDKIINAVSIIYNKSVHDTSP